MGQSSDDSGEGRMTEEQRKAELNSWLKGYEAGIADAQEKFLEVLTDVMRERGGLIAQVESVVPAGRPN